MVSVDSEDHVLSIASEYVEDNVAGAGAKFDTLSVEDLVGEFRVRHNSQVSGAKFEEDNGAVSSGEGSKKPMVQVIANLEPVSNNWEGKRAGREVVGGTLGNGTYQDMEN